MNKIKGLLTTAKSDWKLIKRSIKLVESFKKGIMALTLIGRLLVVIKTYVLLYFSALVLDELVGARDVRRLIILVCILLGSEMILSVTEKLIEIKINVFSKISVAQEEMLLNKKSFSLDYKNMEDPDIKMKRQTIAENRVNGSLTMIPHYIGTLFNAVLSIIASFVLLLGILFMHSDKELHGFLKFVDSPWALLIIGLFTVAAIYITGRKTVKCGNKVLKLALDAPLFYKVSRYYSDVYLDDSKAVKDVHVFGQQKIIRSSFSTSYMKWIDNCIERLGLNIQIMQTKSISDSVLLGITYLFVALKTYLGAFGIGSFYKYSACITNLIQGFVMLISTFINLHISTNYIKLFFEYIDIPSEMKSGDIRLEKNPEEKYEIEFHNVSFKYPKSKATVIKNLSLKFTVGEKLAVVGMNGSGKTTLVKLLCRLYDPTEGYITLNGTDIRKINYEDYLSLFSVVFQDFKLFSFSLGENVSSGFEYDSSKVEESLITAGLGERLKGLSAGIQTPIYKDFDVNGVEISGGEAQKIAIARALYKDAPFVILDEPAAALDPISEYEIYSHFDDIIKNKTAVYISHRLSSCRFCDKIAVFHEGEIIQLGSHEELLEDCESKYYELWHSQAQYYAREEYAQKYKDIL